MLSSANRQLLFEVGGYLFSVDAHEAVEVLEPLKATPVPGSVPGVLGLVNLRGVLVTAGDMAELLELTPLRTGEEALVVFESGSRRVVLRVDRVSGFAPYPKRGLDLGSDTLETLGARDVVAGVGELGPRPFFKLDLEAMFARVLATDGESSFEDGARGGR